MINYSAQILFEFQPLLINNNSIVSPDRYAKPVLYRLNPWQNILPVINEPTHCSKLFGRFRSKLNKLPYLSMEDIVENAQQGFILLIVGRIEGLN